MSREQQLTALIPDELAGERVDRALARVLSGHSRSTLQKWLKSGLILLDDEAPSQRDRVRGGEVVEVTLPEAPAAAAVPEAMSLDIVYQDHAILVVAKPAGLVVHPGAGNLSGTLMNGLLALDAALSELPRAGIVHRLDKDTSGLLLVARTEAVRLRLIEALAARQVERVYDALVVGRVVAGGVIDEPIQRDPRDRRRMTIAPGGKSAVTHYRVAQRFRHHTLLRCRLETGRTHQIRVHLRHLGFPLVGDRVYGGRLRMPAGATEGLREVLPQFRRQALHARSLSLSHPLTGEPVSWRRPMPEDLRQLCAALQVDRDAALVPAP